MSTRNINTVQVSARSIDRMNSGRARIALTTAHGIRASQNRASKVPTELAQSEFSTSPRMSRAKLVVMPHDGHGMPVSTRNVHGGKPSCRCVSILRGWPNSS
jgi:hypothetical protein